MLLLATTAFGAMMSSGPVMAKEAAAAPVAEGVDIPFTRFTLPNGLTVIVNEDHKQPIVAMNIWYHVGSKNEPAGKSGFAHLFEHLMFNGSENYNDDFFKATQEFGTTQQNGTTNWDRTNYFQTVPTSALDRMLFLESDRMGHLLGAVNQARLDEQRGVVKNEKLRGENQPYGGARQLLTDRTYPINHPYGHTTIGSMADLDAATLDDVKAWFRRYYGPSNATVALSGDVTVAEAREKMLRYFGDIPPGEPAPYMTRWPAAMPDDRREIIYDEVALPRVYRVWNLPPRDDRDTRLSGIFAALLADGQSAPLYKRLVLDEKIATTVTADVLEGEVSSQFRITVTAVNAAALPAIERAIGEEMAILQDAKYDRKELTQLEMLRNKTLFSFTNSLDQVWIKAALLAQASVLDRDPAAWRTELDIKRTATLPEIAAAARRTLATGSYLLTIMPKEHLTVSGPGVNREKLPVVGDPKQASFPPVQRFALENGLKVILVERHQTPTLSATLQVPLTRDPATTPRGAGSLMMQMIGEGTPSRNARKIEEELGLLGASMASSGTDERGYISFETFSRNLDPVVDIIADVVQHPAFREDDFLRRRARFQAGIAADRSQPAMTASRVASRALFGDHHPFGQPTTVAGVGSLEVDQVARHYRRFIVPNNATLVVVGDITEARLRASLETAFAGWKSQPMTPDVMPPPAGKGGVFIVDKPGAVQSDIFVAAVVPPFAEPDEIRLRLFNTVLGGGFVSRININLREDKHWSYGARTGVQASRGPWRFIVTTAVQADKTAESAIEIRKELSDILGARPITAQELNNAQLNRTLSLPSDWESNGALLAALLDSDYFGRPDDYYTTYPSAVAAAKLAEVQATGAQVLKGKELTWVFVGDRARIEKSVRDLNLGPLTIVDADGEAIGTP